MLTLELLKLVILSCTISGTGASSSYTASQVLDLQLKCQRQTINCMRNKAKNNTKDIELCFGEG